MVKEVGDERESASVYPFVGIILMFLATAFLALLAFPSGRESPVVNLSLAFLTIIVGTVLFIAGKKVGRNIDRGNPDAR